MSILRAVAVWTWVLVGAIAISPVAEAGDGVSSPPAVSVWGLRIPATDVDATAAFYREHLGFREEPSRTADGSRVLINGDTRLWITPSHRVVDAGEAPQTYLNLAVNDIDEAMERLRKSGARHVDAESRPIAVGRAATVRDPAGNKFHIIQHNPPRVGASDPPAVFNLAVTVTDLEAAERFYCGELRLPVFSRDYLPKTLPLARVGAAPLVLHGWAQSVRPDITDGDSVSLVVVDGVASARVASTPPAAGRTLRDPFGNALIVLSSDGEAGASPPAASSAAGTADPVAALQSLAWIEGTWRASHGSDELEEVWSAPAADSMMGMFRWTRGGKVWMFELMNITVEGERLVFRLRHFNRDFVPWETKESAFVYPMSRITADEVAFENPERDAPRRFVYRRGGTDELVIRLEGPDASGAPDEFRLKRSAPR